MIKVRIKAIIFTAAAFIFAYLQGGNLPYSLFYGFAAANVLGLISIITHKLRLVVRIKLNKEVYARGDSGVLSTHIYNNSFIPAPYIWLKNEVLYKIDKKYNGDIFNLIYDGNKTIQHQVHFTKRGIFNFGHATLNLRDIFNIFETNKRLKQSVIIKVYPRIYEIEKSTIISNDIFKNVINNKSNIEDIYSTRDIRKYRGGDNLKRINWKVSAKYNELYVRDLDTVSGEEFNIFFDMNEAIYDLDPSGSLEEKMVDFCSSLVHHAFSRQIKTNVYINASKSEKFSIENKNDFDKLMDYFLTEPSNSKQDIIRYLNTSIFQIANFGGIGLITASINNTFTKELLKMKDVGYGISVFYITVLEEDLKNIDSLIRAGIECINIERVL
jgi:hypothetical protein